MKTSRIMRSKFENWSISIVICSNINISIYYIPGTHHINLQLYFLLYPFELSTWYKYQQGIPPPPTVQTVPTLPPPPVVSSLYLHCCRCRLICSDINFRELLPNLFFLSFCSTCIYLCINMNRSHRPPLHPLHPLLPLLPL